MIKCDSEVPDTELKLKGVVSMLDGMRVVIEKLKEKGIRDKVKVLIGGSPISQKFADEIGADGYSANAVKAVKLAKSLMEE